MSEKIAVITGGASGIGAAAAQLMLEKGIKVALMDISEEGLKDFIKTHKSKYPDQISIFPVDVGDASQVREAIAGIEEYSGPIIYLVNAAGVFVETEFSKVTLEQWERVIRINLTGTFLTCQTVGYKMMERKAGSIVNLSSRLGFCGTARHSSYSAAKAGIAGLTRSLAVDLAPYNIRVNALAPGVIETEMTKGMVERIGVTLMENIPQKRFGTAAETAQAIWFLLNQTYLTGQTIHLNGGSFMN